MRLKWFIFQYVNIYLRGDENKTVCYRASLIKSKHFVLYQLDSDPDSGKLFVLNFKIVLYIMN